MCDIYELTNRIMKNQIYDVRIDAAQDGCMIEGANYSRSY